MYKYKLSIIIPTYNTAQYLEQTLNVLVCQSLEGCEIIIIDDNSSDNTEKIVSDFQEKYNNIKYFKNKTNQGQGFSRNIGLEHCCGKFVTFLDSDDWPDLITYETAVNALEKNSKCDLAIWGIKNEYSNKKSSHIRTDYKVCNTINKEVALSLLCDTYSLDITVSSYLGSKIFRNSFLTSNNILFDNILFEDVVFSFKSILYAEKIMLLPNIYTHYYQRAHSIVHSFTEKHISDMFKAFAYIQEIDNAEFLRHYKDYVSLVEKCSKTLFRLLYTNIEDPIRQKELLRFYFEHLFNFCSVEQILEYMDPERIKKVLLNF